MRRERRERREDFARALDVFVAMSSIVVRPRLTTFLRASRASSVDDIVDVEAERYRGGEKVMVTHATVKLEAVDKDGHSVDFRTKPEISDHLHP